MDFKDKVVIVTGSSSGIGEVCAEFFAKSYAKVVVVGRNEEKLEEVAKKLENTHGIKPLVIVSDLTNDDNVRKVIDETVKEFGQIDVLVNSAGVGQVCKWTDGIETFDRMIALNLRSVYLLTSLAAPYLIKSKGNVINVSSTSSIQPNIVVLPYCIAKAGLDMFTKCVAKELAGHGVRVNSVNPGPVKTNFHMNAGLTEGETNKFLDARTKQSPLGYISTCENIAELILFLASNKARSITGSIYIIDNGQLLG